MQCSLVPGQLHLSRSLRTISIPLHSTIITASPRNIAGFLFQYKTLSATQRQLCLPVWKAKKLFALSVFASIANAMGGGGIRWSWLPITNYPKKQQINPWPSNIWASCYSLELRTRTWSHVRSYHCVYYYNLKEEINHLQGGLFTKKLWECWCLREMDPPTLRTLDAFSVELKQQTAACRRRGRFFPSGTGPRHSSCLESLHGDFLHKGRPQL